jgi:predicted dinucleotide-binding enzyme
MGTAFAAALANAGHDVAIGSRDPARAAALAEQVETDTGQPLVGGGIAAAVKLADIVILAVPENAVAPTVRAAGSVAGKVLVDIGAAHGDAGIMLQAQAAGAAVVLAFDTVRASLLAPAARRGKPLQVFVAADDSSAKALVMLLAATLEFIPVDAGGLHGDMHRCGTEPRPR